RQARHGHRPYHALVRRLRCERRQIHRAGDRYAADRRHRNGGPWPRRHRPPRAQEAAMDSIALHPIEASALAPQVDLLFYALLAFSFGLGIFLTVLLVGYAVKYRRGSKANRAGPQQRNTVIEVGWTSATALMALGLFLWGASLFL